MNSFVHRITMATGVYMTAVGVYVCMTIVETAPQGFLGLSITATGVIGFAGAAVAATE